MQNFMEYLKRYFGLLPALTNKNPISIIEVPFKTFYAGELVKHLHNRFRGINELLCIELYIYNCKINTCQKSSS